MTAVSVIISDKLLAGIKHQIQGQLKLYTHDTNTFDNTLFDINHSTAN